MMPIRLVHTLSLVDTGFDKSFKSLNSLSISFKLFNCSDKIRRNEANYFRKYFTTRQLAHTIEFKKSACDRQIQKGLRNS